MVVRHCALAWAQKELQLTPRFLCSQARLIWIIMTLQCLLNSYFVIKVVVTFQNEHTEYKYMNTNKKVWKLTQRFLIELHSALILLIPIKVVSFFVRKNLFFVDNKSNTAWAVRKLLFTIQSSSATAKKKSTKIFVFSKDNPMKTKSLCIISKI